MHQHLLSFLMIVVLLAGCIPAAKDLQPLATTSASASTSTPVVARLPTIMIDPVLALTYPVVDTGQGKCYDNNTEIPCPPTDASFYGQDAQYTGLAPNYTSNGDGTVTDNVTGLTWQQTPDRDGNSVINAADKLSYEAADSYCQDLTLAGFTDWRLPDIKTLYSLMDFRGTDPSSATGMVSLTPFLDSSYFAFAYGDTSAGERTIDSQFASSTLYVDTSAGNGSKDFGVNFADGRIKGYDMTLPGSSMKAFFILCVRGNITYGVNKFADNSNGTVSDLATGLVWQQTDSATGLDWQDSIVYCENLSLAGYNDWRLPDAKELQSILDYSRSPSTTNSAAIDPLFGVTTITSEAGQNDYPFYWTSTTHANSSGMGETGIYIAFGRALGYMNNTWVDVHGAGAQRSDPKSGDPANFPTGRGPQGDAIRIYNYARCVRGGDTTSTPNGNPNSTLPSILTESSGVQSQSGNMPGNSQQFASQIPPIEAVTACASSKEGAFCSFAIPSGTASGTCQAFQQHLACVPAKKP
jgi:hypothetical protein